MGGNSLFLLIHTAASKYIIINVLKNSYVNSSLLTQSVCYIPALLLVVFGDSKGL